MKRKIYLLIIPCIALVLASAAEIRAQHEHHGQQKQPAQADRQMSMQHGSMGMTSLMDEPHDVLAKAHLQNVVTFARTLGAQVEARKSVDAAFAQAAVAEIRRNFNAMQQHLAFYQRSLPTDSQSHAGMESHAGMQSSTNTHAGMADAQGSIAHITEIKQALELLEREAYSDAPRASKVSERAAAIVKHVEMMLPAGGHKM